STQGAACISSSDRNLWIGKLVLQSKPVAQLLGIDPVLPAYGCFFHSIEHRRRGHADGNSFKELLLEFQALVRTRFPEPAHYVDSKGPIWSIVTNRRVVAGQVI